VLSQNAWFVANLPFGGGAPFVARADQVSDWSLVETFPGESWP
jgi:hypothetical protein